MRTMRMRTTCVSVSMSKNKTDFATSNKWHCSGPQNTDWISPTESYFSKLIGYPILNLFWRIPKSQKDLKEPIYLALRFFKKS